MPGKTSLHYVRNVITQNQPTEITIEKYNDWNEYDEAMEHAKYQGPALAAKSFARLGLNDNVKILDVGAGTGMLGKQLWKLGYKNVVALDPSRMLERSKCSVFYKEHVKDYVKKGHKIAIPQDSFDVALICGVIIPGHMHLEDLVELLPLIKPGGLICWTSMYYGFYDEIDSRYTGEVLEASLQKYIDQELLRPFEDTEVLQNFYNGLCGMFYCMQVLK